MLGHFCVHSICIIFLLWHKYSASLQHLRNWYPPPLPTSHRPSRANSGAPIPAPMVALLFRRVLTSVRPTSVPPTPHTVHPSHLSHPASNQPVHKIQCFLVQPILYDPANDTIRYRQYDTIQPTIRYNPADEDDDTIWSSVSSDQKDPFKTHTQLPHCLSI